MLFCISIPAYRKAFQRAKSSSIISKTFSFLTAFGPNIIPGLHFVLIWKIESASSSSTISDRRFVLVISCSNWQSFVESVFFWNTTPGVLWIDPPPAPMSAFRSKLSHQKTVGTWRELRDYFQTGLLYFYNTCFIHSNYAKN